MRLCSTSVQLLINCTWWYNHLGLRILGALVEGYVLARASVGGQLVCVCGEALVAGASSLCGYHERTPE